MTTTMKIILLLGGSIWGLACLVFVVALGLAASKPTPEPKSTRHLKKFVHDERHLKNQAHSLHSLQK